MSKSIKILSVLLMVVMLVSVTNMVFANELKPGDVNAIYEGQDTTKITNVAGRIFAWIRNIAAAASVVVVAILGLKYMIGSTEERADYKKSFIPLIVGMLVVLSASTLATWIWSVLAQ